MGMKMRQGMSEREVVWYLFVIGFFAIFSTTISKNPVLPLFSQALGADNGIIGLIAAVSPLAGILFSFPVGVLSDHLGRRKLLILSGAVFLTAPLLYLLVTIPLFLVPVRFFHGLATAILGPVISAVIIDRFPGRKGEMLGSYSSATLIGRTAAPLAGGLILSSLVLSPGLIRYEVVYLVAAAAAVPVFLLTVLYRDDREAKRPVKPGVFKEALRGFLSDRRVGATALADLATYFCFGIFETFFPLFLAGNGIGPYMTGLLFAFQVLVIAVTKPFSGRVADRVDKRVLVIAGLLLTSVSLSLVPLFHGLSWYFSTSAGIGLGMSLATVATAAYIADLAGKGETGAAMGGLSSVMDIGHSAGPLVAGFITAAAGYTAGFHTGLVVALPVVAWFLVASRTGNRI
jgi:MFS family permease